MNEYKENVLMLNDDDFTEGHAGDLAYVKGTMRAVYEHRIVLWNGRVLKNAYGPIFADPNVKDEARL